METEKILLIRTSLELIRKIRGYKYLPLPLFDEMPNNVGLVTHDGLRQLLKVTGGNCGQACDIQQDAIAYSRPEFYRLTGTSRQVMLASIKKASPEYLICPSWFDEYPRFDGEAVITTTNHVVIGNWLNLKETVHLPKPKPNYSGLLDRALQEI